MFRVGQRGGDGLKTPQFVVDGGGPHPREVDLLLVGELDRALHRLLMNDQHDEERDHHAPEQCGREELAEAFRLHGLFHEEIRIEILIEVVGEEGDQRRLLRCLGGFFSGGHTRTSNVSPLGWRKVAGYAKKPADLSSTGFLSEFVVPRKGLEPSRPRGRQHLKLVRLPISPPGH